MKKLLFLAAVITALSSCDQRIKVAISDQLAAYPESRVQDIYKSFCQDNLGPEHLIPNPDAAREYLRSELETYRSDLDSGKYAVPERRYIPVGDRGNYIRVDLSVVLDSLVSEEALLDAFVSSANAGQNMTPEQWTEKWRKVAAVIRRDFPEIPDSEEDLSRIDSLMAQGHYILHHSPEFTAEYHPHYRIIEKGIFGNSIKSQKKYDMSCGNNPQRVESAKEWQEIAPTEIELNPVRMIDKDWLEVSAGKEGNMNLMTVSWGSIGELWGKPIFTVYVSTSRYTHKFLEENDFFTVTHFPESMRNKLSYLGSVSGRDEDKVAGAGLTVEFTELGNPIYAEADLAIECKKLYGQQFDANLLPEEQREWYERTGTGIHYMYIGEILHVWKK